MPVLDEFLTSLAVHEGGRQSTASPSASAHLSTHRQISIEVA